MHPEILPQLLLLLNPLFINPPGKTTASPCLHLIPAMVIVCYQFKPEAWMGMHAKNHALGTDLQTVNTYRVSTWIRRTKQGHATCPVVRTMTPYQIAKQPNSHESYTM